MSPACGWYNCRLPARCVLGYLKNKVWPCLVTLRLELNAMYHRRPQCLQNFAPRLGHAWRPGPAHTQGVSRTQLVCRVQVSPTLCAKFHADCTVNNMKNPRCATGLSIRYVGLPFVILISFMYDMYFAIIVIWLCICLDSWSIKNYYYS